MSSEQIKNNPSKEGNAPQTNDTNELPSQINNPQNSEAEKVEENEQDAVQIIHKKFEEESDQSASVHTTDNDELQQTGLRKASSFTSEYFLSKHSPSFRCFEQYLCSQSDIKMTLNFFPPLTDPGLDNTLYYTPPEEEPDNTGVAKYVKMCKYLEIVPIKRVIKSLTTDTLNLKYYGLTLKQMRGITDALKVNSNVVTVIFEDNWMSPDATNLISEILRESNSLRILNLRECRIGEQGAEKLAEGIASTQFLQELDLSFNSLGDTGLEALQSSLIENTSIRKLNISHNNLTEESGPILEQIFLENKALEAVDLSWNGFYTAPGNKKLFNGLAKNELINWLNLAWNGIGTAGAMRPISKYLKKTEVLKFLDLSFNRFVVHLGSLFAKKRNSRITMGALRLIRSGLLKNKSLTEVKLGNNIYTPEEAYFLASLLTKAKNELVYLDMEDMCVNKDFLQLKYNIKRARKVVTHGRILNNYTIYGPDINKLLFQRCRYLAMKPKKKKAKKDFGHFILSLPDNNLTKDDFQKALKSKKVKKIDKDLLNELMSRFSIKNGKVDCVTLKSSYMKLYPDTVLPEEKKKKKKKGKKKGKKKK